MQEYLKLVNWKRVDLPKNLFPNWTTKEIQVEEHSENIKEHTNGVQVLSKYPNAEVLDTYVKDTDNVKYIELENGAVFNRKITLKSKDVYKEVLTFHLKEGDVAEVFLDYQNDGNEPAWVFSDIRYVLGKNAKLTIHRVQRTNDHSYVYMQSAGEICDDSHILFNDFQLGAKYKAILSEVQLLGDQCNAVINPMYLSDKDSLSDFSYSMHHIGKETTSHINGNGVLKDGSKKVFRGNLEFVKGSSKSAGREEENCILFDDLIVSDSIPALFCGEDDVIGEHAASIGRVNQDKLFYLMTRGFSEEKAKILIASAVFDEVVSGIDNKNVTEVVSNELEKRIGGV